MQRHGRKLVLLAVLAVGRVQAQAPLQPDEDSLPGTGLRWLMLPVPGGKVAVSSEGGAVTADVPAFWIGQTEVPWELYDVFLLRLDLPREERSRAASSARPSRPYGAPDHGFGHRGYPVISVTHGAATKFTEWLSARTGHRYVVATDAQWSRAAMVAFGSTTDSIGLSTRAWTAANADATTHPVGTLAPDALGAYDLLGNAGEWVTGHDGTPWLRGGRFVDAADSVSPSSRIRQDPSWNQTDPQQPKSRWWLSDGPFAGFRLVRIP